MSNGTPTSAVRTERDGAVLTVRLNNPPFNFLTTAMMTSLLEIVRSANADDSVRAVVLTSDIDRVFISHFDVSEILAAGDAAPIAVGPRLAAATLRLESVVSTLPGGRSALERTPGAGVVALKRYHEVVAAMRSSNTVYVAAINGRALGGGCELALACDIRLMADGPFEIGQPEILIGLIPGGGGTQSLARAVGMSRAIEICLEGRLLQPDEALQIGIIHRLIEPEQLFAEATATAQRLARRSAVAVGAIKRAIYDGGSDTLEHGLHLEQLGFIAAVSDPTVRIAMREYLDQIDEAQTSGGGVDEFIAERLPAWLDGTAFDFQNRTPAAE